MGSKLSGKDLIKLGFPKTNAINIALGQITRYRKREKKEQILLEAKSVLLNPDQFLGHGTWGKVAEGLIKPVEVRLQQLRTQRVPFSVFGENEIDEVAKRQLYDALKLPVSVQGALMPDAHSGYGLPIGGVLATDNAVIPFGVGVDIGCRMSLSIFDIPASYIKGKEFQLRNILKDNTAFGLTETQKTRTDHELFSRLEFQEIPILKSLKDKAYKQLGSSGSGNHFVEFGIVELVDPKPNWELGKGSYLAILSHSGSRGLGANIAKHYSYLATKQCPLPKHVQHLAWLDLDTHDGQEYWLSMNLAGDYAKACHDNIHQRLAKAIGKRPRLTIENHHNFAWKEVVGDKECIVHRKGATPASVGMLGIIPGSMTAKGFIVEGKGNIESINSASHGAGRQMSRGACKNSISKSEMSKILDSYQVELIGGSVDEAPMAYKDIEKVISLQQELVNVLGTFTPKIVRMDK
ncbi:RtcB family protein [Sphingobacterium daejeonense]|uniref:RtcB family protein n=1 Tax=Sphingobacterium daejeonense TaxID=371142 RepID=UPI0010C2F97B|nr:RtcB family protein [Sphingobacterium daejeonense]VTP95485.1 RNA-splicing ligase RtcB [Sphingobacterium daejeonense]